MPETDELCGGSLAAVSFDPVEWTLRFEIEVLDGGERRRYDLMLNGVSEWQSSRGVPLPWDYAELTEVHVSDVMDQVLVGLVLWADDTSLSARCASVRVDRVV